MYVHACMHIMAISTCRSRLFPLSHRFWELNSVIRLGSRHLYLLRHLDGPRTHLKYKNGIKRSNWIICMCQYILMLFLLVLDQFQIKSRALIIGGIAVVLKCKTVKRFIVIKTSIISTFSLYSRGFGPLKSPAKGPRHVLMGVPGRSYRHIYINKNSVEA